MKFDPVKRAEFYKGLYESELSRGESLNRMIQFPTTLIIVLIPTAFYLISSYMKIEKIEWFSCQNLLFQIASLLFALFALVGIIALGLAFHGQNRRYLHLPFTSQLKDRESELYKHFYRYQLESDSEDKRKKAIEQSNSMFIGELAERYIECGDHNMKLNHRRSAYLFTTRVFILLSLIMILIMGILLIYKQSK